MTTIKGIGPGREKQLHKLGITNITSLLTYFPRTYEDRRTIYRIGELKSGMTGGMVGNVIAVQEKRPRPRLSILEVVIADGTGPLKIVLFNQGYKKNFYKKGQRLYAYGKAEFQYGSMQMNTPQIENLGDGGEPDRGIVPIYALADGVSQFVVRSSVRNWFAANHELPEILPAKVREVHQYMTRYDAFKMMHFPESSERYEEARHQLAYEELFVMQSGLALLRNKEQCHKGPKMGPNGDLMAQCIENLPFSLTGDQQRALDDIRIDMEDERPMQRLLQGDVGSGKTLVALMSMLIAIDNGYQACMMAPTEILAEQHLQTIKEFLKGMNLRVELLTGIVKGKKRKEVLDGLLDGSVNIVVGTHAIIEDKVQFHSLGMAVVDEQHRFGVAQRAKLWSKSENPPHVLVMTATPIPRTLAMTIYGDLDVSVIDELPPGRKPIQTIHKYDDQMVSLYQGIRQQINLGRQVYIVFPLIKESEKMDLKNLEDGYHAMCEVFPEFKLSKIHGKMKDKEKEEEMQKFVNGTTQILVATTVIEVGVNVPNASVMIILDAQRFGLSQLHQLRGRVGRGAEQSYCILVTNHKLTKETSKRIDIMCDTNDGFEIAEADLKLRGPGDLEGTQQSGVAFDLKIADIARDGQIVQMAREEAQKIIDDDPTCQKSEYNLLWNRLKMLRNTNINWAAIS